MAANDDRWLFNAADICHSTAASQTIANDRKSSCCGSSAALHRSIHDGRPSVRYPASLAAAIPSG
jgi:hypothetical protein